MLRFPPAPGSALVALLLALVASVPVTSRAAEGPAWDGLRPVRWSFARVTPATAGHALRVERDPDTGLLGPVSAATSARLAAAAASRPETEPLRVQTLPDGSLMIELGERFMWDFTVSRGPDGRLHADCADHPLTGAPAPAGPARAAWPEE